MRIKIAFDMDPIEDKESIDNIMKADNLKYALEDINNLIRSELKYATLSDEVYKYLEDFREKFYFALDERGISL